MKPSVKAILASVRENCDFDYVAFEDINDTNSFGSNALHCLAIRNDIDSARTLITEGINVNQRGEHGYTPLHEATSFGHFEFVKLLLESGANPLARTEGDLPFTLARIGKNDAICELLAEYMRELPPSESAKVWDAHMAKLSSGIEVLKEQIERECPKGP